MVLYYALVQTCPDAPAAGNHAVTLNGTDKSDPAVVSVKYACEVGYVPATGSLIRLCTRGEFNGDPLNCLRECIFNMPSKFGFAAEISMVKICKLCLDWLFYCTHVHSSVFFMSFPSTNGLSCRLLKSCILT